MLPSRTRQEGQPLGVGPRHPPNPDPRNIQKDASEGTGRTIQVGVEMVPGGRLLLAVTDDGQRFDGEAATGEGVLDTMRDYAEGVGGDMHGAGGPGECDDDGCYAPLPEPPRA